MRGLTGGCAKGYQRAGFYVVGVDNRPQPRYCGDEFYQADALEFLAEHGHEFDAIHASPPCQGYSRMRHLPWLAGKKYELLIEPVREAMIASGKSWVIENVADAPLASHGAGVILCGTMFDLKCFRHRRFETSFLCWQPEHKKHTRTLGKSALLESRRTIAEDGWISVLGKCSRKLTDAGRAAMGVEWMQGAVEVSQAVPPAYTEFVGRQLIAALPS